MKTLESLIDFNKKWVLDTFKNQGGLHPMVVGYTPDNTKRIVIPGTFENNEKKAFWLKMVSLVFAYYGVDKYVVMHEGWAVMDKESLKEAYKYGPLANHPNKIEILSIIAVNKTGTMMNMNRILEDKTLEHMEDLPNVSGAFTELLKVSIPDEDKKKMSSLLGLLKSMGILMEVNVDGEEYN